MLSSLLAPRTLALALVAAPRSVAGQATGGGPHTAFLLARCDTWSAWALYAGYGEGPWDGMFALVHNPRTGYREALIGIARAFAAAPGRRVTLALAAAAASDSWYGQLYVVPSLTVDPLHLSGTIEIYVPLEARGAFQDYMSPLSLRVALNPRVELGATSVMEGELDTPTGHALGPGISVAVPHGSISVDWVVGLSAYSTEARATFQAAW